MVFSSTGDLTGGNGDGSREIFLWERDKPFTQLTSALPPRESTNPVVNWYGRFVVFESTAQLVPEDDGASNRRVFLYDRVKSPTLLRLSRSLFGDNYAPRISKKRFVVWESTADLIGGNPDGAWVIFMFDRHRDD